MRTCYMMLVYIGVVMCFVIGATAIGMAIENLVNVLF